MAKANGNDGRYGYTFDGKVFKLTTSKKVGYYRDGIRIDGPLEVALCQFLRPAFYGTVAQCPR